MNTATFAKSEFGQIIIIHYFVGIHQTRRSILYYFVYNI